MREHVEYLNAELDIRIVNRKKRIMEALISISPRFSIKKGAIIGVDSLLDIPLMYQGAIGKVTHLIEFQDSFYIRASFVHDLEDSVFNLMNGGAMKHVSIGFTSYLERQKPDVRIIFSMRIQTFHIHDTYPMLDFVPEMRENTHILYNEAS